jgi:hypothetical protein
LRLANPFHLKDFQSVFSAIDPALIGTIDVYTGGFPANFGDRMSGVIDIHPVRAETAAHREISASLYNASALAAGRFNAGRTDWAVSARRGNLDRVLEWSGMHLGEPAYSDVYARLGHQIGSAMAISANLLQFDDDIELADSDVEEQARARYRDWTLIPTHPLRGRRCSRVRISKAFASAKPSSQVSQPDHSRTAASTRLTRCRQTGAGRPPARWSCSSAGSGGAAKGIIATRTRRSSMSSSTFPVYRARTAGRTLWICSDRVTSTARMPQSASRLRSGSLWKAACVGIVRL